MFREEISQISQESETQIKGNWGRSRPNKKWMKVIEKDMSVCGANENMVSDRERWRKRIQYQIKITLLQ